MSDDLDFENDDDHYSAEFDLSDIRFTSFRNKQLTRIDLVCKAETNISIMRYYCALKLYVHKLEREIGVFDEEDSEH